MANSNTPFGFQQYRGTGSAPTYEQVPAIIAYDASAIYKDDPVTWTAGGGIARSASTGATPADLGIAGIFVGCEYLSTAMKRKVWSNYFPGSGDPVQNTVTGYIINDPHAQFLAQSDSTGLALADINSTIGFVIGTGSTATELSGAYLDTSTLNTSSYLQFNPFKIVAIVNAPPGASGTLSNGQAYDRAIVAFNNVTTRNFQGI